MEVFRAIIELVDKIIWPVALLIIFFCLRNQLKGLVEMVPELLKKREGDIEINLGKMMAVSIKEKVISSEEAKGKTEEVE